MLLDALDTEFDQRQRKMKETFFYGRNKRPIHVWESGQILSLDLKETAVGDDCAGEDQQQFNGIGSIENKYCGYTSRGD
jgi:hypothetical protein